MTLTQLIKSITGKEKKLLVLVCLVIIIVTTAPYLYGYFNTPPGKVYTGIHHLTPGDTNVYLSMIEQVKQGHNVFINPYTSEPQHRLYTNPIWLATGWMAKIFNLHNLVAFQIARIITVVVFIFIMYLFLSYLFKDPRKRKWALFIILFASGIGVFLNPFIFDATNIYEHPTDIWVPESVTFLTLLNVAHLIASLTLIVLAFLLMLLAFDSDKQRYSIGAGVACLLLFWFHPFNGPTIYLVLATYLTILFVWRRKIYWSYFKHCFWIAFIPIPSIIYLYLISRADWVIQEWSAQNILPSPSVWMYVIGYGFILLFAIGGLWISLKKPSSKRIFIIAWAISSAMLLYIPLTFQRRMSEGLHIPLSILAFIFIYYLVERTKGREKSADIKIYVLILFLVVFLPLTNIQILGQDFYMYEQEQEYPYYLSQGEMDSFEWIKQNVTEEEITFSSFYSGNFIPAYSGRKVYIGHGPQTINLSEKEELTIWFFKDNKEQEKKLSLLEDNELDFLFYGPIEKDMGDYSPSSAKYLELVYSNEEVEIYIILY